MWIYDTYSFRNGITLKSILHFIHPKVHISFVEIYELIELGKLVKL